LEAALNGKRPGDVCPSAVRKAVPMATIYATLEALEKKGFESMKKCCN
jgi:hypothetical protein